MLAAEMWAVKYGFNQFASDAEIDNSTSIAAHKNTTLDIWEILYGKL